MKLLDRFRLWRNGYCTKHLVEKDLPVGYFPDFFYECPRCYEDRNRAHAEKLKQTLARARKEAL